uniref:UDP-N-acetylglucosamine 2-epimerase n=1 Tax=Polynucleobacter sp. TaxID=2029855 RepID=UPI004048194C
MKKICVVTGSRADYGLLRLMMEGIRTSSKLDLQLIATGMHLSAEFGLTINTIKDDGFYIDRKVEMLLSSDTSVGVTKSMGVGLIGFADALAELSPDLLLVLGDRFEIFVAATAAMVARIPIAHLHGGELTEGAFDDAIRHSITKMSHLHFVAAEEYRKRVIQLGEQSNKVFLTGGLGIDNILNIKLLERNELEQVLGIKLCERSLLITFHPVTLESNASSTQLEEILSALEILKDTTLLFTMPNADVEGRDLINKIQEFCLSHSNAYVYKSLGQLNYLSCIKQVDGVVGNSSSGLIEVPSFYKGTINIGDRQKGRLRASSVIDCEPNRLSIANAIATLYSVEFQLGLKEVSNPYGSGGASQAIVKILEDQDFDELLKKKFCDGVV